MSIFDKIKNALFHRHAEAAPVPTAAPTAPAVPAPTVAAPSVTAPAASTTAASAAPVSTPAAPAATAATPSAPVDVAAILDAAVKESGQKLAWRHSIVDTMKALGLDSDLSARKELAQELNYTGDTGDSATMNIWLQKALMKKLSENGGKVPAELMD